MILLLFKSNFPRFLVPGYFIFKANFQSNKSNQVAIPVFLFMIPGFQGTIPVFQGAIPVFQGAIPGFQTTREIWTMQKWSSFSNFAG